MMNKGAQQFVEKMREDQHFRSVVEGVSDRTELWDYLKDQGYAFDELDLVRAMASCMAELEAAGG